MRLFPSFWMKSHFGVKSLQYHRMATIWQHYTAKWHLLGCYQKWTREQRRRCLNVICYFLRSSTKFQINRREYMRLFLSFWINSRTWDILGDVSAVPPNGHKMVGLPRKLTLAELFYLKWPGNECRSQCFLYVSILLSSLIAFLPHLTPLRA